jgi:ferredoxin
MQRTAAGKFNGAERAGNAAQLAAYAQAFVQLDRAINAGDGINRADTRAGGIFTVVAELRADSFSLRMTCRRGMDCSPCRRCVSEHAASQVRQPIQTVESAITKRFTGQSSGDSHF